MKGVILAGGTGTRLGALTQATNKHLLPLGSEPMLYRAIRALHEAGVTELAVVTGRQHLSAFAHLDPPVQPRVRLLWQDRPGGIAEALSMARGFAGGEPVMVLLADNVWERSLRPWVEAFTCQGRGARVLLHRSADPDVIRSCGLAVMASGRIDRVVEKPTDLELDYPRTMAPFFGIVTGAYAFDEAAWAILPSLTPSARGELEITDVLNHYAKYGQLEHDVIDGFWCDAGQSIEAYYRAVDFVRGQEAT